MKTSIARTGYIAAVTALFVAANRDPGIPLVLVGAMAVLDRLFLAAGIIVPEISA